MAEEVIDEEYDLKGDAGADFLSAQSYGDAYNGYLNSGGVLFSIGFSGDGFYGGELASRLDSLAKMIQFGQLPFNALSDEDFDGIRRAVMLPAALHYNEFDYVGHGGDYAGGQFLRSEEWTSCDLTEVRDKVLKALDFFCLQAATLAKKLYVDIAKKSFIRTHALLLAGCIGADIPDAGLGAKSADSVVRWISQGIRSLWGEIQIENNLKKWKEFENNVKALTADPPPQSWEDNAPQENDKNADNAENLVIHRGKYGSSVVADVDNNQRAIVFVGKYGKTGKRYIVPPKSDKVWHFLKLLIETGSENGETEMPDDFRYWHGLFRRARKLEDGSSVAVKTDLDELKKHIISCKGAGKRGLPILKIVAEIPRKNARR